MELPDYGVPVLIWVDSRWKVAIRVRKKTDTWYCVESDTCYDNRKVKMWTELPKPPEGCNYARCYPFDRCDRYDENKCSMYHYWVCEDEK
jgi:hypothetical protein